MELGLVKNGADRSGSYYAEFSVDDAAAGGGGPVFMDGDAFEALCFIAGNFRVSSTTTLSGFAIDRLVEELRDAAQRISHSDSPKQVWPLSASYGYTQFNSITDWEAGRRDFSLMLRELGTWLEAARARDLSVTIRGV
ncbi:hypothetical protein [Pelagibius sp.]|uniref:hypothetical protein n=1 Tax=Pelagibius sp. TaxID=1931238 RepID=UPI003BB0F0B9